MHANVAKAEAILFALGEPVDTARLADVLELAPQDIPELMKQLQAHYEKNESALHVMHLERSWQIATKAEYAPVIRLVMESKRMQPLSNAAMEALTIIAYNQPVSKGFVERVRGVDSSSIVNSLVEKGLVEEAGRINVPGKPLGYRTTALFLRTFGLGSLAELPSVTAKQEEIAMILAKESGEEV